MTGPMYMPCDEWAEKLAAKIDELSATDRAALQAHLTSCPACSLAQTDYQMMRRLLHTLPAPVFPAGFPPGLLHLWEEEEKFAVGERSSLAGTPNIQKARQDGEQSRSAEWSPEATWSSEIDPTQEREVLVDRTLHCSVCNQDFLFTASDQAFFLQRGSTEKPKRCPSCLRARMHGDIPLDHSHPPHEKQQ